MSENEPTNHDDEDPGFCDTPGCVYHTMSNAKVRAVKVDDETYVNITDVTTLLRAWHSWQTAVIHAATVARGVEGEHLVAVEAALANAEVGVQSTTAFLETLADRPIFNDLSTKGSPLVTPEATKFSDTIPSEWFQQRESQ